MKTVLVCAVLLAAPLGAVTRYVSLDGAHVPPFTSWAAAATTVHAAVDAAVSGDEILVSNGVFLLPSPVIVSAAVSIVGWQGAAATVLDGGLPARSNRCVELRHSAAELRGLTLTRGSAPGAELAGCGGAVFCTSGGIVRACVIAGNHARYYGGGVGMLMGGLLADCVVSGNVTWGGFLPAGGGIYTLRDTLITNLVVINNRVQYHGGGIVLGTNAALLASTVAGNLASNGSGGAVWALAGARLARCQLRHNRSAAAGAALQCAAGVTVEWCLIEYNASHAYNGDGAVSLAPGCLLSHSIIRANTATRNGAGVYCAQGGHVRNCVVSSNSTPSYSGGGVYCNAGGTIESCTISANKASSGPGIYIKTTGTVVNCIVYHNGGIGYSQIWGDMSGARVRYTCTSPLVSGEGNTNADPRCVNAGDEEYHLQASSPCLDAAQAQPWMATATDLDGTPRIIGAAPDMGAYERGPLVCSFNGSPRAGKLSVPVRFIAYVSGTNLAGLTYRWDINNDGAYEYQGAGLATVTHTYAVGSYSVRLRVDNAGGEWRELLREDYIVVTPVVTNYVSLSGAHVPPFTSWATAATNIQDAIDAAVAGDVVLLDRGVYFIPDTLKIEKGLLVAGAYGARECIIDGGGARRCVWMTNTLAVLDGVTVRNGFTSDRYTAAGDGAGVVCEHGTLRRCIVRGNRAAAHGGGVYLFYGVMENCLVCDNRTGLNGGGVDASGATLRNCTIIGNRAEKIGGGFFATQFQGLYGAHLDNCIVYDNTAQDAPNNYHVAVFRSCATWPLPAGEGNLSNAPALIALNSFHLGAASPCIDAGATNYAPAGSDIAGNPRTIGARTDMGCYEHGGEALTGALTAAVLAEYATVAPGFPLLCEGYAEGLLAGARWEFGDGTIISNAPQQWHRFAAPGTYPVVFRVWNATHAAAATALVQVVAATNYVSLGGTAVAPYTSWASAATCIQDAVDAAHPGGVVLVARGVYAAGGAVATTLAETATNRVCIEKPISVVATNTAPFATVIAGSGRLFSSSIRGALLAKGAVLAGFTITNGATPTVHKGGGVFCYRGTLSNCVVYGNTAEYGGGGVYCGDGFYTAYGDGSIVDVLLAGNVAHGGSGGGISGGTVLRCTMQNNTASSGGGAHAALLEQCVLTNNTSSGNTGGGINGCQIRSSLLAHNAGGGAYLRYSGLIEHATIASNTPYGVQLSTEAYFWYLTAMVVNSIVQFNATNNWLHDGAGKTWYERCSITPLPPAGAGNCTDNPCFASLAARDFHLASNSPCVDAGLVCAWMDGAYDLDGRPRVIGRAPDCGAYEFAPQYWCSFSAVPLAPVVDETVQFDSSAWDQPATLYYRWDFNHDGVVDAQGWRSNAPVWRYAAEGVYSVTLSVSNAAGHTAVQLRPDYVTVVPEPALFMLCAALAVLVRHDQTRRTGRVS